MTWEEEGRKCTERTAGPLGGGRNFMVGGGGGGIVEGRLPSRGISGIGGMSGGEYGRDEGPACPSYSLFMASRMLSHLAVGDTVRTA